MELHLQPGDLEEVQLPEARKVEITLIRRLVLNRRMYQPKQWPLLHALLLAYDNRAG